MKKTAALILVFSSLLTTVAAAQTQPPRQVCRNGVCYDLPQLPQRGTRCPDGSIAPDERRCRPRTLPR